eukprot:SAG11_NODE_2945_length_2820_cov_2.401323_2_plen_302_part_00
MGRALAALPADVREKMIVSTKATPGAINFPVKTESLDYDSVTTQLRTSVEQLGRTVDIFYLHSVPRAGDRHCTLEETLRAVNDLHEAGLFERFGVSNFPAFGVMMVYYKCKELHYVLPTVYQGHYNALTRQAEAEVFPCLRALGMKFYAHGPLFAGVLATAGGRSAGVSPADARERAKAPPPTPMELLPDREPDPSTGRHQEAAVLREARAGIVAAVEAAGLDLSQATMRWMLNHSAMGEGDGMISGAANLDQVAENMAKLSRNSDPLPSAVLAAYEHAWNKVVAGPDAVIQNHWFAVASL